jgi:hypothetical protein
MTLLAELYGKESLLQILFVTCLIGGGTAWITGHALADSWRSFPQTLFYLLLLGAGVRFAHFALFQSEIFSWKAYLSDTAFLILAGGVSWRLARVKRMVSQYRWLYEQSSLFTWRERGRQSGET